ncbi:MAG TPA: chorismate-binding protein [Cyclobacteriaceae bacterium]|nr:chorismate-binding protein [Cyclobacteriaceae bacterium]
METIQPVRRVNEIDFLSGILPDWVEKKTSYALWRLPNTTTLHLLATDRPTIIQETNLEESPAGFLFAPFDPTGDKYFFPADEYHTFEQGELSYSSVQREVSDRRPNAKMFYPAPSRVVKSADTNSYTLLVEQCIAQVSAGNFEKLVPSRCRKIELPESFNLLEAFQSLCAQYPHAMVSVVSSPALGTWMGATPEMLVRITPDQHFQTVAIAGTQAWHEGMNRREIAWSQKEIQEQALVVRYIISCFKKIRLREYEEQGPSTIQAGNVLHLKTEFDVDMVATNFPLLGTTMLQLLHPTSAVCGMPLAASLAFLREHEGYDRQFYSGYLGPVNLRQETNLYVNLRCTQILDNQIILYAGAGVLADSDPLKEWHETEMKMSTLLRIIQK